MDFIAAHPPNWWAGINSPCTSYPPVSQKPPPKIGIGITHRLSRWFLGPRGLSVFAQVRQDWLPLWSRSPKFKQKPHLHGEQLQVGLLVQAEALQDAEALGQQLAGDASHLRADAAGFYRRIQDEKGPLKNGHSQVAAIRRFGLATEPPVG